MPRSVWTLRGYKKLISLVWARNTEKQGCTNHVYITFVVFIILSVLFSIFWQDISNMKVTSCVLSISKSCQYGNDTEKLHDYIYVIKHTLFCSANLQLFFWVRFELFNKKLKCCKKQNKYCKFVPVHKQNEKQTRFWLPKAITT